jgi:hypothetical protein
MTAGWVGLCRNKPAYREAWIEGVGVGQSTPGKRRKRKAGSLGEGPGTELHTLLNKLRIRPALSCKCMVRIRTMNEWGPDKCRQEIDTILGWLQEEAKKRKLPFIRLVASMLVRRAIRNANKKQARG